MEIAESTKYRVSGGATEEAKTTTPQENAIDKIIELYKQKDNIPHIPKALTGEVIHNSLLGTTNSFKAIRENYFADEKNKRYKEFNECAARGIDLIYKHNPDYDFFKDKELAPSLPSMFRSSQQNTEKKYTKAEIKQIRLEKRIRKLAKQNKINDPDI